MPRKDTRAGCILVNSNGKLLIVHNTASGFWGFPKGRKDHNETHIDAALRELREETGKIVDPGTFITSFSSNKAKLYLAVGNFEHECVVDGTEIDAYKWATIAQLRDLPTSKFTQAFFNRVESTLRSLELSGIIVLDNNCI